MKSITVLAIGLLVAGTLWAYSEHEYPLVMTTVAAHRLIGNWGTRTEGQAVLTPKGSNNHEKIVYECDTGL